MKAAITRQVLRSWAQKNLLTDKSELKPLPCFTGSLKRTSRYREYLIFINWRHEDNGRTLSYTSNSNRNVSFCLSLTTKMTAQEIQPPPGCSSWEQNSGACPRKTFTARYDPSGKRTSPKYAMAFNSYIQAVRSTTISSKNPTIECCIFAPMLKNLNTVPHTKSNMTTPMGNTAKRR